MEENKEVLVEEKPAEVAPVADDPELRKKSLLGFIFALVGLALCETVIGGIVFGALGLKFSKAAAAIEGSTKYLVSELLIAVFDLRLGFHAGVSSMTKSFLNADKYERKVFSLNVSLSSVRTSRSNEATVASEETLLAYALMTCLALSGSLSTSSTLEISDSTSPS